MSYTFDYIQLQCQCAKIVSGVYVNASEFKTIHKNKTNPQKIFTKKGQINSQKQTKPTENNHKKIKTLEEISQNL